MTPAQHFHRLFDAGHRLVHALRDRQLEAVRDLLQTRSHLLDQTRAFQAHPTWPEATDTWSERLKIQDTAINEALSLAQDDVSMALSAVQRRKKAQAEYQAPSNPTSILHGHVSG
ncbi:MAG: hypothetical protein RhofKO_07590 [Rhodothermales bacterium]